MFVDSRVDILEYAGVFRDYLTAKSGVGSLDVLDKYHIRYVLHSKEERAAGVPVNAQLRVGGRLRRRCGRTVGAGRTGSLAVASVALPIKEKTKSKPVTVQDSPSLSARGTMALHSFTSGETYAIRPRGPGSANSMETF